MIVKVCGITSEADARAAIEAGANALGFNFWPRSPRYIAAEAAAAFVPSLSGALKVGVFVDSAPEEIAAIAGRLRLDVAQLHGAAMPPPAVRFWRGASAGAGFDVSHLNEPEAEAYLLDTPAGALHGGTGRTFDWTRARTAARRIIVAGGLDASNVAEAIAIAQPWGVDSCSRLESSPGVKDHAKVAAFVAAALSASLVTRS